MKKNVLKLFLIGVVAVMMSSCVILVDEEPKYGQIEVINTADKDVYSIERVYCKSWADDSWSLLWDVYSAGDDSECWFDIKEGHYSMKVSYIVYKYDYVTRRYVEKYREVETCSGNRVNVDGGYRTVIYFDGENLYE